MVPRMARSIAGKRLPPVPAGLKLDQTLGCVMAFSSFFSGVSQGVVSSTFLKGRGLPLGFVQVLRLPVLSGCLVL